MPEAEREPDATQRAVERAMRRALQLALNGPRGVNPQVGAVILSPTGEVLAEGWHRGAGTPHAEIDALTNLAATHGAEAARGATAVVTLEPCNHTGRTGPCAVALLEAGVDVEAGVLGDEGRALLDSWLTVQRLGRPHVTVKWAQSLDGRAAASDGTSQWITGPAARADVHVRRAAADAIVVGTGTLLADDPALTARRPDGSLYEHQPRPVVVGTRAVPQEAAVRRHPLPFMQDEGDDLADLLDRLRELGAQRVFVEGGPTLASSFVRAGLVDELLIYLAPTLLGGDRLATGDLGVPTIAAQRRLTVTDLARLGDDLLVVAAPEALSKEED